MPEPEIFACSQHLWETFWQLDASRGGNGYGPNPLSYGEIEAWCRLKGETLSPDEMTIIRAMDAAYMAAAAERSDEPKGVKVVTDEPMSPEIFDGVL